jgi:hypothetical protein
MFRKNNIKNKQHYVSVHDRSKLYSLSKGGEGQYL